MAIASICLDDGTQYQYEHALPILEEFKVNATWALCYGLLGQNWQYGNVGNVVTLEVVEELKGRGDEIADHTGFHTERLKDYKSNYFKAKTFVYPFSNVKHKDHIKKIYNQARACKWGYIKKGEPFDRYELPVMNPEDLDKDWDYAIFYFHANVDKELRPLLEDLEKRNIKIMTINDAMEELNGKKGNERGN